MRLEDKKLFLVDAGTKDVYVVADGFDEAVDKALDAIGVKSLISHDGSLNLTESKVKSVKLITEKIVY